MIHPPQDSATPAPGDRRRAARQSAEYFLALAPLLSGMVGKDLVTTLTFLSISRANVRAMAFDPARAMAYAGLGAVPPDSERVPVTVYAVARELGIPYETVRRHAHKLREAGLCQSVTGGLIVPASAFIQPTMLAAVETHWALIVNFVNSSGGVPGPMVDRPPADVSRQAARGGIHYFLDILSIFCRVAEVDALAALVLRAVSFANVEAVHSEPTAYPTPAGALEDAKRDPVSIYAVAKTLNLPYETTRRHALRLIEQGLLEKSGGGVIIPERVISQPRVLQAVADIAARTDLYLATLAELGLVPGAYKA